MIGNPVIAAIVSQYVSDALYRTIAERATPLLPDNPQEERKASYSLDALLWEPSIPNHLRRKYLLSIAFGVLAGFFITFLRITPAIRIGRYFLPACFYSRSRMVC